MAGFDGDILDRMVRAVEIVRERLRRATAALEAAGVPYALADDNAVAAWVARVDKAAVRNTPDVDILLRRHDLPAATAALSQEGFVYRAVKGVDLFLDGPDAKPRDAVHVMFAAEKVRQEHDFAAPDVAESETVGAFKVLALDALVRMQLTSFRIKNCMHLRDLIDVGLIDDSWPSRLPAPLAARLQQLLDTPES